MRGLLSSRLLKGPSGAERLSKSLFRHSKLRKRSKRPPFRRPKSLLQTHVTRNAAARCEDGKKEEGHAGDSVVRTLVANVVAGACDSHVDVSVCENNDVGDHVTAVENTQNGQKEGKELHVAGAFESVDDSHTEVDYDVTDVDNNVLEIESSAEESESELDSEEEVEEDEEEEEGKKCEDRNETTIHASSSVFGNGFENSIGANVSSECRENNPHLPEENVAPHVSNCPKGPLIFPDWEAVRSIIAETPEAICFICGGKNTGKSTFARYVVNSLLNRYGKVGFLDTDVGQPEFTPSGCLSLHVLDRPIIGLPALEMKNPERCYFFGDTSPKSNPEDYLKCIYSLYDYFKDKYSLNHVESKESMLQNGGFPLVINTHGWIQGVGLDVLVNIINYVMPTHVVRTVSRTSTRNLPPDRFWESSTTALSNAQLLYIFNAIADSTHLAEIKYDARELRDLRLLSYFQKSIIDKFMLTCKLSSLFEKAASALACCRPFQVPISAIHVLQQHFEVPAGEIVYSLNATLVGLGVSNESEHKTKPWCVGLGIVRAVDVSRGLFYVITPLKLDVLQRVNTFLQGRMEIPVSLLKAPKYVSPYLCKNTISMEGTGSAAMGKGKKKVLRMLRSPGR